ncbi:hypothetical protein F5050DRAFT_1716646, partial [Lentinula boryana]
MDLFNASHSHSGSAHNYVRRSRRLLNIANHTRIVSDQMDVDYDVNVENTDSERPDVVMQDETDEDSQIYDNEDDYINDDTENVLVANSSKDFQRDDEDEAEQFEIDNEEELEDEDFEEQIRFYKYEAPLDNVEIEQNQTSSTEPDESHFPRLFSPELDDDSNEDPYLSDSAVEHRRVWVYSIDIQRPLEIFSELSSKKSEKEKQARAEEHQSFWADKKQHGLEDIKDRFERFS